MIRRKDMERPIDDGCNYLSMEELQGLMKALMPGEFDSSDVGNKALDVNYGSLPEQQLDVYYPDDMTSGGGPYPVIFFIHGGGWIIGNRRSGSIRSIIKALKHGYAVIAVEYRMLPKVRYPEFIYDIKTAIRWARANAVEYRFDPDRFGIIGDSAGGYNALVTGFTAGNPEYEGNYGWEGYSSSLRAICDIFGPTDLAADNTVIYRQSGVKRFVRPEPGKPSENETRWGVTDNPGLLSLFSPVNLVRKDIPPVFLLHGKDDGMVPYQHSIMLYEKIIKVCGRDRAELRLFDGVNHADPFFFTEECTAEIISFFDRYLK